MNYESYLNDVNKTFLHSEDKLKEYMHCAMAIPSELGEVMDLLKKHYAYGVDKDDSWRRELELELGDVLYYVAKLSEMANLKESVSDYFEGMSLTVFSNNEICATSEAMKLSSKLVFITPYNDKIWTIIDSVMDSVLILAKENDIELKDIIQSNVDKRAKRHGNSYNHASSTEAGRDRVAETNLVKISELKRKLDESKNESKVKLGGSTGAKVKAIRKSRKMTQGDLCEITGINVSVLCHLETGKTEFKEWHITAIANAFNMQIKDLK